MRQGESRSGLLIVFGTAGSGGGRDGVLVGEGERHRDLSGWVGRDPRVENLADETRTGNLRRRRRWRRRRRLGRGGPARAALAAACGSESGNGETCDTAPHE